MKVCFINAYQELNINQYQFFPQSTALGCHLFDGAKAIYAEGRNRGHIVYSPENAAGLMTADAVVFIDWNENNFLCRLAENLNAPKAFIQAELPNHCHEPPTKTPMIYFSYTETPAKTPTHPFNYTIDRSCLKDRREAPRSIEMAMISTNHEAKFEGELYSTRRKIAQSAKAFLGNEFRLFGRRWESTNLVSEGFTESKADILKSAKFTICLENSYLIQGYVTEKILEPIFYGSIPIYYCIGHSKEKLPREVFINAAEFDDPTEMIKYCNSLRESDRLKISSSGWDWMTSNEFDIFDADYNSCHFWNKFEKWVAEKF